MKRTKDFRRHQERLKDLRRRKLYRNHAINGRYEVSDKEDDSVTDRNNPCCAGMWRLSGSKKTIAHHKLNNTIGHWQQYPKPKNYMGEGYHRAIDRRLHKYNKVLREDERRGLEEP